MYPKETAGIAGSIQKIQKIWDKISPRPETSGMKAGGAFLPAGITA
jgi:hypothetical protein